MVYCAAYRFCFVLLVAFACIVFVYGLLVAVPVCVLVFTCLVVTCLVCSCLRCFAGYYLVLIVWCLPVWFRLFSGCGCFRVVSCAFCCLFIVRVLCFVFACCLMCC